MSVQVNMHISNYMKSKDKIATTVKVDPTLYDEFKILGVKHKVTLQRLVEKAVFRYVKETIFRNQMDNFSLPSTSAPSVEQVIELKQETQTASLNFPSTGSFPSFSSSSLPEVTASLA